MLWWIIASRFVLNHQAIIVLLVNFIIGTVLLLACSSLPPTRKAKANVGAIEVIVVVLAVVVVVLTVAGPCAVVVVRVVAIVLDLRGNGATTILYAPELFPLFSTVAAILVMSDSTITFAVVAELSIVAVMRVVIATALTR